ncbi:MAG: hypothetical protein ACR2F6_08475 [Mycobacteriales bacterium]
MSEQDGAGRDISAAPAARAGAERDDLAWDDLDWGDLDETGPAPDETDHGWKERSHDDETWLREQVPPHHGGEAR